MKVISKINLKIKCPHRLIHLFLSFMSLSQGYGITTLVTGIAHFLGLLFYFDMSLLTTPHPFPSVTTVTNRTNFHHDNPSCKEQSLLPIGPAIKGLPASCVIHTSRNGALIIDPQYQPGSAMLAAIAWL